MFSKRPGVQLAHRHCVFETFCLRVITRTADSGQVGGWVMQCIPHVRHHLQNDCTRDIEYANRHDPVAGSDTRGTRCRRGWRALSTEQRYTKYRGRLGVPRPAAPLLPAV
jgi:hypothetical protein